MEKRGIKTGGVLGGPLITRAQLQQYGAAALTKYEWKRDTAGEEQAETQFGLPRRSN
ncbi:protein of unknown function (plasmid) [Cupriavidus taiwanensis]|uniref:Uncharacterized protein n=1 Tax=Cupriavidus taiwanensis TaxID=164546 RepID=A0A7Z7JIL3_9BURK|nr:hypothetical protein CBM2597_U40021 [Cupriavidus taiwanensis]SOZ97220.1 hypothetical protein CBM2598_U40016 [Cupriavidus taiwanensis]SPC26114.1 hypothetical protein CBM2594_U40019 [Cupriavidus taiwanensis]SPD37755.1 protein of unknown function [Cupriavidus taiwanensis]